MTQQPKRRPSNQLIHRSKSCPEHGVDFHNNPGPCFNADSCADRISTPMHNTTCSIDMTDHGAISSLMRPDTMIKKMSLHPQQLAPPSDAELCFSRSRHRIGHMIETRTAHIIILILTLLDIILVIIQIGASLLHLDETKEEVWFIKLFEHLSLAIVSVFMLETLLKVFAFGPRYFWRGTKHGLLHLLDALIILTSFLLEIFLRGAAEELTSLLILFRLWRIIKLTGTVAIEVSEHDEARSAHLEEKVRKLEKELEESRLKLQKLEGFSGYNIKDEESGGSPV